MKKLMVLALVGSLAANSLVAFDGANQETTMQSRLNQAQKMFADFTKQAQIKTADWNKQATEFATQIAESESVKNFLVSPVNDFSTKAQTLALNSSSAGLTKGLEYFNNEFTNGQKATAALLTAASAFITYKILSSSYRTSKGFLTKLVNLVKKNKTK